MSLMVSLIRVLPTKIWYWLKITKQCLSTGNGIEVWVACEKIWPLERVDDYNGEIGSLSTAYQGKNCLGVFVVVFFTSLLFFFYKLSY